MTKFDISKNTGVWFDMEGGGRVKLRTLPVSDLKRINKATITKTPFVHVVDGREKVLTHEVVDDDRWTSMVNDCCIVDWENLFDKDGNKIECNADNKDILMCMEDDTFREFVKEKLAVLSDHEKKEQEAAEKN